MNNLLEWEPKDGWEPLCAFLGKSIPEVPFPYANQGNDVSDRLLLGGKIRLAKWAISKVFWPLTASSIALVGASWWWLKRS